MNQTAAIIQARFDRIAPSYDALEGFEEGIASLRESQHRIDLVRDDLATRESELKVLELGEQLVELEAGIREDLLDD